MRGREERDDWKRRERKWHRRGITGHKGNGMKWNGGRGARQGIGQQKLGNKKKRKK